VGLNRLRGEIADVLTALGLNAKQVHECLLSGRGLTDLQIKTLTTKESIQRAFRRIGRLPEQRALAIAEMVKAATGSQESARADPAPSLTGAGSTPAGAGPAGLMIRRCGALSGREYAASFERFSPYWKDHLDFCRTFILEGAHKVARKTSVTVVGASEARDLPLQELARAFDTVNLVDIDEPSMQIAIDALRQSERTATLAGKVRCVVKDITGDRIAGLVADCFGLITSSHDPRRALCGVTECYERYDPGIPDETVLPLKASYVISSGVASQLLPVVLAGVRDALRQRLPRFQFDPETQAAYSAAATGLRQKLIGQHAVTLAAMAEEDGLICWWDTVAQTPGWGQLTGQEQLDLLGVVSDWVHDSGGRALAAPDLQAVIRKAPELRQLPGVLSRLIRENLLPVQEVTALIDRVVGRAAEMSASTRAVLVPGGLAAHDQGRLVPDGPPRSWRWILNPPELASLQVEAVHLKRR
jgi:hypothetical protein